MSKRQANVVERIREMILQGQLAPSQKVVEVTLAKNLGVSRTPIRQALPVLAEEGLLVEVPSRGFEVRAFSFSEIFAAIEIRGALEGLSARMIVEQGAPRGLCRSLHECLDLGDQIFSSRTSAGEEMARYSEMNILFHSIIVEGSGSKLISETFQRISRIPFVGVGSIVSALDKKAQIRFHDNLLFAHRQHHSMVQAIENGEGARVEALLKEHVYVAKEGINLMHSAPATEGQEAPIESRKSPVLQFHKTHARLHRSHFDRKTPGADSVAVTLPRKKH
jgi:GntR family transcriptional regulator of vanillate catabolism